MSTKKVILTGSTGLIGKEAVLPLKNAGFEVICLTSKNCDLFDRANVVTFFEKFKAEYLLHFAWFTGENYLSSEINKQYLDSSLFMLEQFAKTGGKRAVFAGTCFEYQFKDTPLKETDSLEPKTLYAECKVEVNEKATEFCSKNGISFGWGRIFYVYGHNEGPTRLTASILNKLKNNEIMQVNYGQLEKDYIFTKDIAQAFTAFLDSNVTGAVNIGTGKAVSLEEYAQTAARILGKEHLLDIKHLETSQPQKIVADISRLRNEVGYVPKYDIYTGLKEIIDAAE